MSQSESVQPSHHDVPIDSDWQVLDDHFDAPEPLMDDDDDRYSVKTCQSVRVPALDTPTAFASSEQGQEKQRPSPRSSVIFSENIQKQSRNMKNSHSPRSSHLRRHSNASLSSASLSHSNKADRDFSSHRKHPILASMIEHEARQRKLKRIDVREARSRH